MSQANDQMIAFNKTVLEAASRFAAIALEGAEEMMKVQMEADCRRAQQQLAAADMADPIRGFALGKGSST